MGLDYEDWNRWSIIMDILKEEVSEAFGLDYKNDECIAVELSW